MRFEPSLIPGAWFIKPDIKADERGSFHRVWDVNELTDQIGEKVRFVQHNHSVNRAKGTVRGLHYQEPPKMEGKLVKCITGSIYDVIVDLRKGSSAFLKHVSVKLDSIDHSMIYIPQGCAHGFQALEDNTHILYYHTEFYHPTVENGIRYDDPLLAIQWPLAVTVISERDSGFAPLTKDFAGF